MNDKSQVESILNDIRAMVNNVIIKLSNYAEQYETADIKREADRYIAAYLERDTFNSYRGYPFDVLAKAGISNLNDLYEYSTNRHSIPRNKRNDVLKAMRQTVIDEYEERNDYYRNLIGKPPIDTPDEEFIYLTEEEMKYYEIDEVRPIHDYPKEIQIKLERELIPQLIELYPERTYLQHMGSKSVNLVRARQAKNFDIIFTDINLDVVFMRAFFETYDFAREYFMSVLYNKAFKERYDLYDNYIGMHIMIMTIQRLIVDTIKMGIDRDFYDLISIKKLFNVYGVPFYEDLPLDYQRTIVKNVNMLIRSKSTDKALYDIANTLFYERVRIFKYYLVKERKFDEDGEPVTLYKYVGYNDEPEDKLYLKSNDGNIYYVYVENDKIKTEPYYNTSVKAVEAVYVNDEFTNKRYKISMNKDIITTELYTKHVKTQKEVFLYNTGNIRYKLFVENDILASIEYPFPEITDYSKLSIEKVYIRSSNRKIYELAMKGDRLVTFESTNHKGYAPKYIYMRDNISGEKFKLYMINDKLYGNHINDDEVNKVFTSVFLYNEDLKRFKLSIDDDRLKTSPYGYNVVKVYDYEKMYDVYFQAVDIMETNVISSLETKYNRYEYDEVVEDDVYWWETEELKNELYARDYTYIDTKYISVTVMQNLTKMLYETSYYLNLLVDHKNTTTELESRILNSDSMKYGTDYLYLNLDRFSNVPVSIFDAVMMLCALVSKKNGMKGNIIVKSPAQILSVLGFNFELNFDLIRENIKKYKRIFKNQEIVKYLDLLDIRTVKDIDTLYNNFRNFAEFCSDMIATTNDINEYKAYKELYKVFTVRKDTTKLFTMSDGNIATTYLEYLYDKLPNIAVQIDEMHKDKTGIYIEHILGRLNELIPEIEYLNTMNGTNNNIVQAILGLINFFKSYTVDLRTLNIMYMFDNKMLNKIYMIDDPRLFITLFPNETLPIYNDTVKPVIKFDKHDNLIIFDPSKLSTTLNPNDYVGQIDKIQQLLSQLGIHDILELDYKDTIEMTNKERINDIIDLRDLNNTDIEILYKDKFGTKHNITLSFVLYLLDKMELEYKDVMTIIVKDLLIKDIVKIQDLNNTDIEILYKDKFGTKHTITLSFILYLLDKMEFDYKDVIKDLSISLEAKSDVQLKKDNSLLFFLLHFNCEFKLNCKHNTCIGLEKEDVVRMKYSDVLRNMNKELALSNNDINFNDSIKVTYED